MSANVVQVRIVNEEIKVRIPEPAEITANVLALAVGGGGSVDSVNGQIGVVTLDAGDLSVADAGNYYAATDVEAVLQEIGLALGSAGAVDSVNGQTGVVVLGAADVGADPAGTAAAAVAAHAGAADPHPTYLTAAEGNAAYEALGAVAAHTGDATDAHDASAISVVDVGTYFTGTDVEAVLQEIGAVLGSGGGAPVGASYLTLGTNGTLTDERVLTAGSGIDFTDAGAGSTLTIAVDPSEFANNSVPLAALDTDVATQTELNDHLNDASDAHDASAISNVAAGNIVATDVQAAINELDTEKIPWGGGTTAASDSARSIIWPAAFDADYSSEIGITPGTSIHFDVGDPNVDNWWAGLDINGGLGLSLDTEASGNSAGLAITAADAMLLYLGANSIRMRPIAGTPEGVITESLIGSLVSDVTNGELYVKTTGAGNTGWERLAHVDELPDLAAHLSDATDAHDASAISVLDVATNYTGTDVEAVLAEIATSLAGKASATDLSNHLSDATDAHDASAISVADAGTYYAGTDVEAVLQEVGLGRTSGAGLTYESIVEYLGGWVDTFDRADAGSLGSTDYGDFSWVVGSNTTLDIVSNEARNDSAGGYSINWILETGGWSGVLFATLGASIATEQWLILRGEGGNDYIRFGHVGGGGTNYYTLQHILGGSPDSFNAGSTNPAGNVVPAPGDEIRIVLGANDGINVWINGTYWGGAGETRTRGYRHGIAFYDAGARPNPASGFARVGWVPAGSSYEPLTYDHIEDTSGAHAASAISVVDAGTYYTGTDVEAVLQEVGLALAGKASATDLSNHLSDATDAHDASAISIVDAGNYFTGTDVEAALQELGASPGGGGVATDAIWDAKGDLAVGTGANTASKLTVGTDGYVLTADSATATGLKWAAAAAGVTWPLLADNGSVGAPSYAFTNDPDCGWYRIGANNLGLSIAGALALDASSSRIRHDLPITINGNQSSALEQLGITDTRTITGPNSTSFSTFDIAGTVDYSTGTGMAHRALNIGQSVDLNGGLTLAAVYALNFAMTIRGAGTVTAAAGVNALLSLNDDGTDNAPTITTGKAVDALINVQTGSVGGSDNPTMTTAVGVDVTTIASAGSGIAPNGIITTAIGLRMTSLAANTAASGALSGGTVWGMQVGDYQSYHHGRLSLGGTTAPTYALDILGTAQDRGVIRIAESSATPTNPASSTGVLIYHRADKIIFAFNDAGTMRYKYLDLNGTGTTWTHTTTAPT